MAPLITNTIFGWLFGQGWWSAGLVLTCCVGFAVPYAVAASAGRIGTDRNLTLVVLAVFVGPLLAFVYGAILEAVADPEPGCIEECWGRLGLAAFAVLGAVVWEVGLGAGSLHRFLKSRRRSHPDRR